MRPAASPGGGRRMSPGEEALRSLKRPRHPVDPGSGSDPGSSSGSESDGDFVRCRASDFELFLFDSVVHISNSFSV